MQIEKDLTTPIEWEYPNDIVSVTVNFHSDGEIISISNQTIIICNINILCIIESIISN